MRFLRATLRLYIPNVIFMAAAAQAELSGGWSGWGEWNFDGSGTRCHTVYFRFVESERELTRAGGRFDCDFVSMDVPPLTLRKDGQSLLLDGQVVGSFDGDSYEWGEFYSDDVKITVTIRRNGLHLDYTEQWMERGKGRLYDIRARLFKAGGAPLLE